MFGETQTLTGNAHRNNNGQEEEEKQTTGDSGKLLCPHGITTKLTRTSTNQDQSVTLAFSYSYRVPASLVAFACASKPD